MSEEESVEKAFTFNPVTIERLLRVGADGIERRPAGSSFRVG